MYLTKKLVYTLLIAGFFSLTSLYFIFKVHDTEAQSSMTVKDLMSNSQLSFFGRLDIGNSSGNSILKIITAGTLPSTSTNNIFIGDTLAIGSASNSTSKYTVRDVANLSSFVVEPPLNVNNIGNSLPVFATRSAIHRISFTPQVTINSGIWRFLIRAPLSPEFGYDGIPNQTGFDIGSTHSTSGTIGSGTRLTTSDISCPAGFGTPVSNIGTTEIIANNPYFVFTCQLGAGTSNPVGVGATWVIGRDLTAGSQLINPSPARNHIIGSTLAQSDSYSYILQLKTGDGVTTLLNAPGKIAVIESVRVTATVDPLLIFQIGTSGVGVGSTVCGNLGLKENASDTTATAVNYGSLIVNEFNDLAHKLTCATNAINGYVVTVHEASRLQYTLTNGAVGATFSDTTCDIGNCTVDTPSEWSTDVTTSKFGYSIHNIDAVNVSFNYNDSGRTFNAKPFGIGAQNARPIMWNDVTPSDYEDAYVCYRTSVNMFQQAANYQTGIVYTATATF